MSKAKILKATRSLDSLKTVLEVLSERAAITGHEMLVAALTLAPVPELITRAVWYAAVSEVSIFTAHASGKCPEDCVNPFDAQKWLHRSIAERLGLNVKHTDGSLIEPQLVPMKSMANGKPKMRMVSFKQSRGSFALMAEYHDRVAVHNAR